MRTLLYCLPLFALGATGCLLDESFSRPASATQQTVAKAPAPSRLPAVRPVTERDINETNAHEMARLLTEEMDRDQQPEEETPEQPAKLSRR